MITVSFYSNEVIDHNAQSVKDHLHKIFATAGHVRIVTLAQLPSVLYTTSQSNIHY